MFYQHHHSGSPDYLKIERGENFSFSSHLHQCFEIIILLSGQMKITVDSTVFVLEKNEALLIFPNQIHKLESTESEHILCIFSPQLVQTYTTHVAGKIPENNKFLPDTYFIKALESLQSSSSSTEKKGVLYSLCGQFDRSAEYIKRDADNQKLLHKIFSFVEDHFSGQCSLSDLSAVIGYDYSYLSRYFKKTIGISFNSYVNYYRLSHACYLMENTEQTILQCAYNSGFCSLRNFNRRFRENFKITPTQYRKRIRPQQKRSGLLQESERLIWEQAF